MASSFQSTAFQGSARPVDTFVAPPSVQPKTGIESLAETLAAVNPNLQKFFQTKIEDTIEDERADMAIEIGKKGFKQITKEHRDKYGDDATNQLIGGSIFAQDEFEIQKATYLGNNSANEIEALYNSKRYPIISTTGEQIEVPLSHFSIDSPEYQAFQDEAAQLWVNKTQGISNKNLNKHFLPKQRKALIAKAESHRTDNNNYRYNRIKKATYPTLAQGYLKYIDGDEEGLNEANNYFDKMVLLGITQDKKDKFFDTTVLDSVKSLSDEIFATPGVAGGIRGSRKVWEYAGKLKYGPSGTLTLSQHPKFASMRQKQIQQQIKDEDSNRKIYKQKLEEARQLTIDKYLKENINDPANLKRIRDFFADDIPYIEKKIGIYGQDRLDAFREFSIDLTNGEYTNRPFEATKKYTQILNSMGGLQSKEERTFADKVLSKITDNRQGKLSGINSKKTSVLKRLKNTYGTFNELSGAWVNIKDDIDPSSHWSSIERNFERDFDVWLNYTDDGEGGFINRTRKDIDDYLFNEEVKTEKEIQTWLEGERKRIKETSGATNTYRLNQDVIDSLIKNKTIKLDNRTGEYKDDLGNTYLLEGATTSEGVEIKTDPMRRKKISQNNTVTIDGQTFENSRGRAGFGGGMTVNKQTEDTDDEPIKVQVRKGDTLFGLSQLYNTSVEKIKDLNGLTSDVIRTGQELIMPTITKLVNTVGDAVVPKEDLKNRSVLEEIDVTKPFSYDSLYRLAMEVGFPPEDARIMAAIALAESKGDAQIDTVASGTDPNKENEFSLGLWQINVIKEFQAERFPLFNIKSPQELYNPLTNAKAAFILYSRRKPEERFDDWSTYLDGSYKKFLPKAK